MRAAQQLTEKQRRNNELIVRVEREKQLEIENCTINKYRANMFLILFFYANYSFHVAIGRERSEADKGRVRQTSNANRATPRRTKDSSAAALRGGDESSQMPRRTETNEQSSESQTEAMGH